MEKDYIYNAGFFENWLAESELTQEEFQKRLDIKPQSFYRWVRDKKFPMKIEKVIAFCNEFNVDIHKIIIDRNKKVDKEELMTEVNSSNDVEMQQVELKYLRQNNILQEKIIELHEKLARANEAILQLRAAIEQKNGIIKSDKPVDADEKGAEVVRV